MSAKPLAALYIRVANLDRAVEFYGKILDAAFRKTSADIAIADIASSLTLVLQASDFIGVTPAISFAVDNLDAIITLVTQSGGVVNQGKQPGAICEVAELTDPDGNPIEFVQLNR